MELDATATANVLGNAYEARQAVTVVPLFRTARFLCTGIFLVLENRKNLRITYQLHIDVWSI